MKDIKKKYHHIDHSHCWNKENPPCGQRIKHLQCCLCGLSHPEITDLINQTLETQALALEGMKFVWLSPEEIKEHEGCRYKKNGLYVGQVAGDNYNQALQQAADHLRAQKIS